MDNWKSIYIYFISGTGNARISSEWIADEARKKGLKAVVQQIDRLENIVMLKGYKCIGFRPVDLPSNWIPLHPGLKKKVIESIFIRCEKIVRKFADKILTGKKVYRGLYSIPIDLLISPIALGYYIGGRFFLSKTFIANYNCNNCGLCIKECPTSSIRYINDRPYWKLTCESCMRCLNHCPQKAIEAAHGMAVVFWIAFTAFNALLLTFIVDTLNIHPEAWWWKLISSLIAIAGMVLISSVLYRIVHYAMGLRPVKYLVRFTSLTALPFWRRYKHPKDNNNSGNSLNKKQTEHIIIQ